MNRFYTTVDLKPGEELLLEESVSHHMIKVLRFKPGTQHVLFNGQGGEYLAEFIEAEKKLARIKIISFNDVQRESPLVIHLYIAISKGDRMEWVMQKCTELGVTEITPIYTEFSDHKLKAERLEKKMRHWQQVIISACEQSERTALPILNPAININALKASTTGSGKSTEPSEINLNNNSQTFNWVMHPGENTLEFPSQAVASVNLLVGPEGGFSENDITLAATAGFVAHSLGPRIFRTETAPLVAISILQQRFGDF